MASSALQLVPVAFDYADDEAVSPSARRSFNTWSIVFSHPEDFLPYDLETDRWIVLLRRAFIDAEVLPLELYPYRPQVNYSWIDAVNNDSCSESSHELFDTLQARLLCENIEPHGARFVAILDGLPRVRRTFKYFRGSCIPSPLEILGWAVALRARRG